MTDESRITVWLNSLRRGSQAAATKLWNHYYSDLVRMAHREFAGAPQRVADADDAVTMAFSSFCKRVQQGQFPNLEDRGGLWRLLFTITARKVAKLKRDERRLKRGGGTVRGDSVFLRCDDPTKLGLDQIPGIEPTPEDAAYVVESLSDLLELLNTDEQRIAIHKLEGYSNLEIAEIHDCAESTVERRLRLIRQKWEEAGLTPNSVED